VKYLLLAYASEDIWKLNREEEAVGEQLTASWVQDVTERGIRLMGSRLRPVAETTTLRFDGDDLLISDGPFAETKEQLAGFEVLECGSLDEAVKVASRHPGAIRGTVELRPLLWD
jgi:hypothetical protein